MVSGVTSVDQRRGRPSCTWWEVWGRRNCRPWCVHVSEVSASMAPGRRRKSSAATRCSATASRLRLSSLAAPPRGPAGCGCVEGQRRSFPEFGEESTSPPQLDGALEGAKASGRMPSAIAADEEFEVRLSSEPSSRRRPWSRRTWSWRQWPASASSRRGMSRNLSKVTQMVFAGRLRTHPNPASPHHPA